MSDTATNLLLQSLSAASRGAIQARATAISVPFEMSFYEPDRPLEWMYFLTGGLASIVTPMQDGVNAEVGMIGREGVVGALHLIGPTMASTRCVAQLAGTALRVPMTVMRELFLNSEEIRERMLEFLQASTTALGQIAGCNRLHEAEERLARWLLMAQDRVEGQKLDLTQQFLADMLGARRTTVTMIAGMMQRAGLIEYERGQVRILDRARLEQAACECYGILRQQQVKLYRPRLV